MRVGVKTNPHILLGEMVLELYSVNDMLIFTLLIITSLVIDLYSHKYDKEISFLNAFVWTCFWVALSFTFALYIGATHKYENMSLFLTGYVLEKSLAVDNLFAFVAVFSSFAISTKYQHRILYFGVLGAIVLRFIFISIGTEFFAFFGKFALFIFASFVLWSAWKMWSVMGKENEDIEDYTNHWSVKLTKKIIPVYPHKDGHNFFHRDSIGWKCTPLFLCLVVIEIADLMFAFDSVPAVIAVTQDKFLVYTSNIFAILGLRSMYFLLIAAKKYLIHLEKAIIGVLIFIGLKLLLDIFGIIHLSATAGLFIVLGLISTGIVTSFIIPEKTRS